MVIHGLVFLVDLSQLNESSLLLSPSWTIHFSLVESESREEAPGHRADVRTLCEDSKKFNFFNHTSSQVLV